jgi:hypothetical protein
MKRLFLMLGLFALVAGFCIFDVVYTTRVYGETYEALRLANASIEAHAADLTHPETLELCEKAAADWEQNKRILSSITNHNIIRYIDEKFIALLEQVRRANVDDASVTVKVLMGYVEDLREESHPVWDNIF